MPANRLAQVTEWADKVITETCRAQGWDPAQWEFSVTLDIVGQPPNAASVWTVLLTLDSALIGTPCLMFPARILGARPSEDDVREVLAGQVMPAMWMARMQQIGVKARSNGHGPKPPLASVAAKARRLSSVPTPLTDPPRIGRPPVDR